MLIVDAQVHLWGGGTPLAHHRQISSYSTDELLREMDEGGVDAAIIHPPSWDPNSSELALEAARQHPGRLSILGKVPVDDPEAPHCFPVGGSSRECWVCGLLSFNQAKLPGPPTAPWTGSGRPLKRPGYRWP